jgi:hypothetical protein
VTVTAIDQAANVGVGSDNITADNTAPTAVTDLVAKTVSPGGHQQVALTSDHCLNCPHRVAFIPFLVAGDPNLETTAIALKKLDEAGATVIELGVPYSVSIKEHSTCRTGSA